jgi:hypothetical protein
VLEQIVEESVLEALIILSGGVDGEEALKAKCHESFRLLLWLLPQKQNKV